MRIQCYDMIKQLNTLRDTCYPHKIKENIKKPDMTLVSECYVDADFAGGWLSGDQLY